MTTQSSPHPVRIAIIGAGISGLACGLRLHRAGHTVQIFEKSRGPGGRMSTRRHDEATFDHGAQYFTAQRPEFVDRLHDWHRSGIVQIWNGRFGVVDEQGMRPVTPSRPRWVAVPGMSALSGHLCRDLSVRWKSRITKLQRTSRGWVLSVEDQDLSSEFDMVIISCPGPQAAALLPPESPLHRRAAACRYQPCWSAMLDLEAPLDVEYDGIRFENSDLSWAARDSSKPGRPGGERWVLHATPEWSARHVDRSHDEISASLTTAMSEWCHVSSVRSRVHRWLYARSQACQGPPHELDRESGIGLCGDGLTGPRVEDAWWSGHSLAGDILTAEHASPLRASSPARLP